ncbi:MAG: hypothetical protein LBC19_08080 [Tannerella sp.]|nr:hypothetical protein [Tannerella sp.]
MTNRRDFIEQSSAIIAGGLLSVNLFPACQKLQMARIAVNDAFMPLPAGQAGEAARLP